MKKLFVAFVFIGLISSCNDDDRDMNAETSIVGTWKLSEIYNDPGDGSGTFEEIDGEKMVTFHADGTFTSNGIMCSNYVTTETPSSGTYSMADSTFMTSACDEPTNKYKFEISGKTLSIYYPCIEGCGSRYSKQ
ncbi:lipocalin-like domain-containing protein [Echinicola salinicaeni]|uniref:lipocalin family protein n=1 Tax=Echinicola salinicaeni TaxID=2762757 RepID=UPI00164591F7|nr:lipocalin family protein [Echinicola salinicaeni]